MSYITKFSGILIFMSAIFTIYSYFFNTFSNYIQIATIWISAILLFKTLKKKLLISILLIISSILYIYINYNNLPIDYYKALSINQYLLVLLISVGFLKLIATPRKDKLSELPNGKSSFIKTYLGIHLFGSVINVSSLLLVADKMYKKGKLSALQIILLTRSFASDAYWSPFFVAFAAAITYAPNLNTFIIISFGISLAFICFILTFFEVSNKNRFNLDEFYGYPLSLETLYIPAILAFLVLLTYQYYEDIKIIVLISSFAFLMTFFILPIKKGLLNSFKILWFYIIQDLPQMKSEISLFLVAGVFGVLVATVLTSLNFKLPFDIFDYKIASILLLVFIVLGFIGIHPIISIAILGDFIAFADHTLLAVTFLMAWATTVSTSPISGLNLTMSSKYSCSVKEIFKLNIFYTAKIYFICVMFLFVLSEYILKI